MLNRIPISLHTTQNLKLFEEKKVTFILSEIFIDAQKILSDHENKNLDYGKFKHSIFISNSFLQAGYDFEWFNTDITNKKIGYTGIGSTLCWDPRFFQIVNKDQDSDRKYLVENQEKTIGELLINSYLYDLEAASGTYKKIAEQSHAKRKIRGVLAQKVSYYFEDPCSAASIAFPLILRILNDLGYESVEKVDDDLVQKRIGTLNEINQFVAFYRNSLLNNDLKASFFKDAV